MKRPQLTRWEFERDYTEKSGVTEKRVIEMGLEAEPCKCGDRHCRGWQMTTEDERQQKTILVNERKPVPR